MKWTNYRLGDLIEIKHGYAFSGTYITQEDNGIVLVTPGNFRIGGGFQEEKCKFFNGDVPEEYILRPGDLIVTMTDLSKNTDTLGYSALVPKSSRTYLHNQRIGLVKMKTDCVDYKFLYWLMRTHTYQRTIANSATGATVKHTSPTKIYEYQFNAPEKNVQKKIAGILSAYDDLIENNQKQIKLLEEAAMRLYKEWFVKLRFPGHENTKIVDGVPERWRQGQLREYIKVNPRSISKNYPYQEIQYIDIGSVNHGRIEKITTYRLSDAPGRAKRLACDGDTIWGMVRPNLKAYALVLSPGENYVFSTGFAILSPKNIPYTFLYCLVTQDSFVGYLINCTNGSAYPAVKPIHFEEAKVIIPDEGLLVKFHDIVNPMYRRIKVIENQNLYLEEARDRLLPKLMSGEIEV